MSSVHADTPERWEALLSNNVKVFESNYKEDQLDEDLETFRQLQKHGLLVLEYRANWRGISDWPEDESERGIPWLFFAVKKDAIASDFVDYLCDWGEFQATIWELRGRESREPLYSDYFYKCYKPASDSDSHKWKGVDSRSDNPKLSLEMFKLDHLTFDVYVCEVGMRSDFETVDKMSSEEFYNDIKDEDLAGDICTAMDKAHIDNGDIDWLE
ncbi:hypothetical protein AU210_016441 [Fusarium oxysporum f. sp. radicis-cucumerinum]|uniref:Uncharacterized protein n=1 Tax=Fusarium oxysporum f. sp. radicis-cucumerinum TaxID=327505 RepID=A0A2H3G8S6_FUSOX|nr:hypothetical protein AU210_016441 [Fusarium oxysporum f. sp. radicis-cucumerinum]